MFSHLNPLTDQRPIADPGGGSCVLVAGCLATPHAAAPLLPSPRGLSAPSHSVELCKLYFTHHWCATPKRRCSNCGHASGAQVHRAQHDEAEDAHDLRAPPGVPHCGPDWRGALREQSRYRVGVHDRMQFSAQACRAWAFAMQNAKCPTPCPPTPPQTCAAAVAATAVGTRRRPRTKCLKSKKKGKCDCSTKKCKKTRKRCKATS